MVNQIKDPPLTYDFGLDFNYAVWPANTMVTMVNVPWNNDYRDIVKFATKSALNTYIDGLTGSGISINNMSYLKPNQPVRINVPFNRAYMYNYLRASNPIQPIPGSDVQKDFYYFITDVRYLAPNTTELVLQLDVWQTFGYDVTFGNCYVERGHIGIANTKRFQNHGRDYLTVPEGFDVGDLQIIRAKRHTVMSPTGGGNTGGSNVLESMVMVISSVSLTADPGDVTNPRLVSAKGGTFDSVISGASVYAFKDGTSFSVWLEAMQNKPWVTQGIINAMVVPSIERYLPAGSWTWPANGTPKEMFDSHGNPVTHSFDEDWRIDVFGEFPERYWELSKFLTSDYTVVELTTNTGNPIIIKPELWNSEDAVVTELIAYMPPGAKMTFYPQNYNGNSGDVFAQYGEELDHATHVGNFPTVAIVNNMAIGYLAANINSIGYQRDSADWTQQRALGSNQASYDVQTQGMETARALTGIGISADVNQTANINRTQAVQAGIGAAQNVLGGSAGGLAAGPPGVGIGMAQGAINAGAGMAQMGVQLGANNEALAIRNNAAQQNVNTQNAQSGFARDTNKNLQDWAARGDYANSIAGINAKVRDSRMIQPSVSGQMGGETLNYVNGRFEIGVRYKIPDLAAITRIGEYWLRYGYAIRNFIVPPANLMVMEKFTYWKMQETYITTAPMPESFKQTIRGIFEKGVTVWASPAYIGNIDIADNAKLPGIEY